MAPILIKLVGVFYNVVSLVSLYIDIAIQHVEAPYKNTSILGKG